MSPKTPNRHISLKAIILILFILYTSIKTTSPQTPNRENTTNFFTLNSQNQTVQADDIANIIQCTCDLTPNTCDFNCCCDLECPVKLLTKWAIDPSNVCQDKQESESSFTSCFSTNVLTFFNQKRGMRSYKDSKSNLICVTFDNSSRRANFFTPVRNLTAEEMTELYALFVEQSKAERLYNIPLVEFSVLVTSYTPGEAVLIRDTRSSVLPIRPFFIYGRGAFGECLRNRPVLFMEDIESNRCGFRIVMDL